MENIMALIKRNASATAATEAAANTKGKFEAGDSDAGEHEDGASVETVVAEKQGSAQETGATYTPTSPAEKAAVVKQEMAKAVALKPEVSSSVAAILAKRQAADVVGAMKDSLRVDFNTLTRIQANNGNFLRVEDKKPMGDTIEFELISWQDNYQLSPGTDGDEGAEMVKYSDDGITTKDGISCQEHLAVMKEMYPNAAMTKRCVVAGQLNKAGKLSELEGSLFQIDLSQTSRGKFETFRAQSSWDGGKGKRTAENVLQIRAQAEPVTKGKNTWTVVNFTYALPADGASA